MVTGQDIIGKAAPQADSTQVQPAGNGKAPVMDMKRAGFAPPGPMAVVSETAEEGADDSLGTLPGFARSQQSNPEGGDSRMSMDRRSDRASVEVR